MKQLKYSKGCYRTSERKIALLKQWFPSVFFYTEFLSIVKKSSALAKRGKYGDVEWSDSSHDILSALEKIGVPFEVSGLDYIENLKEPCVFIGNHMSLLETVVLPVMIQPLKKVTFVVKQSLLDYPVFKYVMRSRDPIAVSRTNPRQDLKTVLEGGMDRLKRGISIIVFPQTTRTHQFDPRQFGSIGIKLACKAKVPVVPIALYTAAWGNGKFLKDFGGIYPDLKVKFAFGSPLYIQNRGSEEHQAIIAFIQQKLSEWLKDSE